MSNNKVIEFYRATDTSSLHRTWNWYVPIRFPEYKEFCKKVRLGYELRAESLLHEEDVKRIQLRDSGSYESMRFLDAPASDLQSWLSILTAPPTRPLKGRGYAASHVEYIDMLDFINFHKVSPEFNRYNYLRVVHDFLAQYGHIETKHGLNLGSYRISPEAACALIAIPNDVLKLAKFVI